MNYYQHVFRTEIIPNRKKLHVVTTHALETLGSSVSEASFSVSMNGRLITLNCEEALPDGWEFNWEAPDGKRVHTQLISKTEQELKPLFTVDQKVMITGLVSYGVHSKKDRKKHCPIFLNRIHKDLKAHFISKLESTLGLEIEEIEGSKLPNEIIDDHVHLNNQMQIEVIGKIKDANLIQTLPLRSILQRRSYGMGLMNVFPL